MVEGAKQLYFLGIFGSCCHRHDIFKLRNDDTTDHPNEEGGCKSRNDDTTDHPNEGGGRKPRNDDTTDDPSEEGGCISFCLKLFPVWENKKKPSAEMRDIVQRDLSIKKDLSPSFYELRQIAYYFLQARETLKDDKYTYCDIFDNILKSIASLKQGTSDNGDRLMIKKSEFKQRLTEALSPKQQEEKKEAHGQNTGGGDTQEKKEGDKIAWSYFDEQMSDCSDSPAATGDEEYSLEEIEKWMERARSHCLFLANTLASAKELVRCLNNIISWLLIAATFILWLLLNGFATTRVLVLFGSPFVAASFIFGDTCKTLFQGIIFVYVVHPFDVDDLCIIDENMMEVRTIGVWITTFSKVDTQEEVKYPNSQLFTKTITYHKTSFDWNDHIELEVGSVNIETKRLKEYIENHFKRSKTFIASLVVVSRAGNGAKIAITFKSNKDMKNSTYSQRLKEKQKLKSEFQTDLQDMIEQKKDNNSSSNDSTSESTDLGKSAARKS